MKNDELPMCNTQEYKQWLRKLKERVRHSQLKAAVKVNTELLNLYWNMGKEMVEKQKQYAWRDSFIKNLSKDLKQKFPDMKGFSEQNLMNIRYWYPFYSAAPIFLQPVRELEGVNGLRPVIHLNGIETLIKSIPWGHNQRIMYIEASVIFTDASFMNGLIIYLVCCPYIKIGGRCSIFLNQFPIIGIDGILLFKIVYLIPELFLIFGIGNHKNVHNLRNHRYA